VGVALATCVPIGAAHADTPIVPNPNFGQAKFPAGQVPVALVTGDFNQDGQTDVATANSASGTITIETSADGHQFSSAGSIFIGAGATGIATADFNGDHDPDLAVSNGNSGTVEILLGGPGASFGTPISVPVGFFPNAVAVADLNGDTHPDLVVALDSSDGGVAVLRGLGGTAFASPVVYGIGDGAQSVAIGDFNGDHDPDVAATTGSSLAILRGGPGTTLAAPIFKSVGPGPGHSVVVGDFNRDNDPDLAVENGGNEDIEGNVSVFLGGPGTTFADGVEYPAGAGFIGHLAIGDLDNDGLADIAVADYATNNIALLFGDGHGKFAAPFLVPEGGSNPIAVAVTNFDENLPDLIAANNQSDDVTVLINFGPGKHAPSPAPDLVVRALSTVPAQPAPGDKVTFRAKVTNEGDIATPAGVVVGVAFAVDGQLVSWSAYQTNPIPAGGAVTLSTSGGPNGVPTWTATPGPHVVSAFVDDQHRIFELDELNNTFSINLTIHQPLPDLVASKVVWTPAAPGAGSAVKFIAVVTNQGDAPTPAGVVVGVAFIVDSQLVTWSAYQTAPIAPGATTYLGASGGPNGPTWTATPGEHFVRAFVDDQNRIAESNEGNNETILDAHLVVPGNT
jgi:hypothetical protein